MLLEDDILDIQAGHTVNPVNPKFPPQKIYKERHVLAREAALISEMEACRARRKQLGYSSDNDDEDNVHINKQEGISGGSR